MKTQYSYVIIRHNNKELSQVYTLLDSKHNPKAKFAIIFKTCHKDGSESITHIRYSNDLLHLHNIAIQYPTWFNYPLGLYKSMAGNIEQTA